MSSLANERKLSEMEEQKVLQWTMGPAISAKQEGADATYFLAKRVMDLIIVVLSMVFLLPLLAFIACSSSGIPPARPSSARSA